MSEATVFEILSGLIRPYAKDMAVKYDTDTNYYLEETISSAKPQMFCAVQVKKSYTSFHVFPVYSQPELLDAVSDDLKKRMQGKSCFNFKTAEQVPIQELKTLLAASMNSLSAKTR